ncbi:hypothetical protein DDE74_20745 [Streptomyces lydicus]|uniref:Integral membrane protein n=1 Tax=Streptomyces lydicus TaxID=47763 RepID=A0A3Q9KBG5_9ACTN|nr:hypothetical protein [Streptomyces lydicus]AZS73068.1 hypothetical protein DDE74_20745 [Streptomyces lydicus]
MTPPPASTARAAADLRLLRAAVFTAACITLSAAGHILASCATVPLWTLGIAAAAVFAVVAPLAGRERSLPGIAVGLAMGQLVLHAVFTWGQQPVPAAPRGGSGAGGLSDQAAISMARHLMCGLGSGRMDGAQARRVLGSGGFDAASAAGVAAPAAHGTAGGTAAADTVTAHTLLPSLPMLLGHLLAALTVGWLLRRGEIALWRLVRLSAPAVQTLVGAVRGALVLIRALLMCLGVAHDEPRRAPVSYGDDKPGPKDVALHHSVVRRGPPTLALAA